MTVVQPSPWCTSTAKRIFDVLVGSCLLLVLVPFLLIIALAVWLTSGRPVLFSQPRMGKDGREFKIYKFRTMHHRQRSTGPVLTKAGDSRLTPIGIVLRRVKLDELPQLFQVIQGRMSFVGPRPQPTKLWAHFEKLPMVLKVRPGITGTATLAFRNEEKLLENLSEGEVESVYLRSIMPVKMRMDEDYLVRASFLGDLKIMLLTVMYVFKKDMAGAANLLANSSASSLQRNPGGDGLASPIKVSNRSYSSQD